MMETTQTWVIISPFQSLNHTESTHSSFRCLDENDDDDDDDDDDADDDDDDAINVYPGSQSHPEQEDLPLSDL